MAEAELTLAQPSQAPAFRPAMLISILVRPRGSLLVIVSESKAAWLTPLLALSLTSVALTLSKARLAETLGLGGSGASLPEAMWYTPEQLAQLEQAMTATSGPVFVYVFPTVLAVMGVWLAWLLLASSLHLASTFWGGRASIQTALNLTAWASVPLALRDLIRIVYMQASKTLIVYPGLSGLATDWTGTIGEYGRHVLVSFDLYLIWLLLLLFLGVRANRGLSSTKALMTVTLAIVAVLGLQALPGTLTAKLSAISVIRPFMF